VPLGTEAEAELRADDDEASRPAADAVMTDYLQIVSQVLGWTYMVTWCVS
jgi:hypothetical protein